MTNQPAKKMIEDILLVYLLIGSAEIYPYLLKRAGFTDTDIEFLRWLGKRGIIR